MEGCAPEKGSGPAGQWQFRKVNRPQPGCCLFFGGGGHEAGPQPSGGKSPEREERGGGAAGTGHRLADFRHNRKRGGGAPGRPPHQLVCAVTLRRPLPAVCGSGSRPGDLIWGAFRSAPRFPPAPPARPRPRALRLSPRGRLRPRRGLSAPGDQSPPDRPGAGLGGDRGASSCFGFSI